MLTLFRCIIYLTLYVITHSYLVGDFPAVLILIRFDIEKSDETLSVFLSNTLKQRNSVDYTEPFLQFFSGCVSDLHCFAFSFIKYQDRMKFFFFSLIYTHYLNAHIVSFSFFPQKFVNDAKDT